MSENAWKKGFGEIVLTAGCICVKTSWRLETQHVDLRYLYCQPLRRMTTNSQKDQILESLQSLDQAQAQKVLDYIKGLVLTSRDDDRYQKLKREGLKEIRRALGKGRKLNPAF